MDTKHKKITLSEKLNVIREVEAKSVTSWVEIANRLGLAPSSLSRIMLNKNEIIEEEMKYGAHSKRSMDIKMGANEGLEKILLEWF
jgi:IS30 family transposase